MSRYGRGERIRTSDLRVPNAALYQAEPRPDETARAANGAEGGTRTHMRLPSTVFETVASAIPPLRRNGWIIAEVAYGVNFYPPVGVRGRLRRPRKSFFGVFWRLRRQNTPKIGVWGAAPRTLPMPCLVRVQGQLQFISGGEQRRDPFRGQRRMFAAQVDLQGATRR